MSWYASMFDSAPHLAQEGGFEGGAAVRAVEAARGIPDGVGGRGGGEVGHELERADHPLRGRERQSARRQHRICTPRHVNTTAWMSLHMGDAWGNKTILFGNSKHGTTGKLPVLRQLHNVLGKTIVIDLTCYLNQFAYWAV